MTQLCLNLCNPTDCSTTRLSCPSLSPRDYSNSCPLSWWCHPTFFSCPRSFPASGSFPMSQLFVSGSQNIGASVSISPSNEYSGLISFRVDWFDLAIQGILKRLLQHHSLKTSVLQCSAFFILQLSHSYMTTGQTIALKRWTFVGKKCLCFLICCLGAP